MQSRDRKKKRGVVHPCAIHTAPVESFTTLIAMVRCQQATILIFMLI